MNEFDSPISEYPGKIKFPVHLTGGVYRRYLRAVEDAKKEILASKDEDALVQFGLIDEREDGKKQSAFSMIRWRIAVALMVSAKVENVPENWLDPSGDNAPVTVMAWVIESLDTWITPLLTLKK